MINQEKPSLILIGGHIIECFDNTLYGFFAVFLANLFFPSSSPEASLLCSYGAFAAGFFAQAYSQTTTASEVKMSFSIADSTAFKGKYKFEGLPC